MYTYRITYKYTWKVYSWSKQEKEMEKKLRDTWSMMKKVSHIYNWIPRREKEISLRRNTGWEFLQNWWKASSYLRHSGSSMKHNVATWK